MAKPKSRPQRWADAVSDASDALSAIEEAKSKFEDAMSELQSIKEEYEEWKDNLPENLAQSPLGEKLEEVCNFEFDSAASAIEDVVTDARSMVDDAGAVDLPRGFGKD
jgi:exonuclease VII small subunit